MPNVKRRSSNDKGSYSHKASVTIFTDPITVCEEQSISLQPVLHESPDVTVNLWFSIGFKILLSFPSWSLSEHIMNESVHFGWWDFSPAQADDKFVPIFRRCQIGAQHFAGLSAWLWAFPEFCYWLESALQSSLLPNHVYWQYPVVESQAVCLLWRKAKALLAGRGCIRCCKNVCRKKLKQTWRDMGVGKNNEKISSLMWIWPSCLGKERPVSDEMHLISPALHERLNLVLPSVPQLQSLEKPQLVLCSCLEQAITSFRIKRTLLPWCV